MYGIILKSSRLYALLIIEKKNLINLISGSSRAVKIHTIKRLTGLILIVVLSSSLLPLGPVTNLLSDEHVVCKKHGSSCSCAHFCNIFYKQKSHLSEYKGQSSQGKASRKCHSEAKESKKNQAYQKIYLRNGCGVKGKSVHLTNVEPFLIREISLENPIHLPIANRMDSNLHKKPCFYFDIPSPQPQNNFRFKSTNVNLELF